MGLFSSVTKVLKNANPITAPLGILNNGGGSSIGGILNDVTGVSSSAKQAQQYTQQNMATSQGMTLEQMEKSHQYALEQMAKNYAYEVNSAKNAIQWQMQDLKNAGLNPYLAAGFGGANLGGSVGASGVSGGTSAPGGSTGASSGNPLDLVSSAAGIKKVIADAKLAESQALKTDKEAGWISPKAKQEISESKSREAQNNASAKLQNAQTENTTTETTARKGHLDYTIGKLYEIAEKKLGRPLTEKEKQQAKKYQDNPDQFIEDLITGRI